MAISVLDIFKVGIGPSSSHTVGPMRAARTFAVGLQADGLLESTVSVRAELFGSLGATGHGHGSPKAVILGLLGAEPDHVDVDHAETAVDQARAAGSLALMGSREIAFDVDKDIVMHRRKSLPFHPNGMTFAAFGADGESLRERTYYSVGGGFVVDEEAARAERIKVDDRVVPYPFRTGDELLAQATATGLSFSSIMLANEASWRPEAKTRAALLHIWDVMQGCVTRGYAAEGVLPGSLKVVRRAPAVHRALSNDPDASDPLHQLDWVNLFALAVNEENAAGGRVVTAPTNGAAGVIPAVLHYYRRFVRRSDDEGVLRFLLAAGAIGVIYLETASISGAEVGCQGEVGSACSMAAGALCEVLGGTPHQVENAAEIGMEHNLGLTCDPVGGLVQIPCIERNAMGAVKAINAARMALSGDGSHFVSLDNVIKTMRQTGMDMKVIYKETSRGGLAVNVIEC
jgi:L-serine dehydratase